MIVLLNVAGPLTTKAAVPNVEGTALAVLKEPVATVVIPLRLFEPPEMVFVPVALIVLFVPETVFVAPVMVLLAPTDTVRATWIACASEPLVLAKVVLPVEPSVPST